MKAAVLICAAAILLSVLYYRQRIRQYKKIQKNMAVRDKCSVYIGEERRDAVITAIFDQAVIVEDEDGDPHQIHRTEIYPPRKLAAR